MLTIIVHFLHYEVRQGGRVCQVNWQEEVDETRFSHEQKRVESYSYHCK